MLFDPNPPSTDTSEEPRDAPPSSPLSGSGVRALRYLIRRVPLIMYSITGTDIPDLANGLPPEKMGISDNIFKKFGIAAQEKTALL